MRAVFEDPLPVVERAELGKRDGRDGGRQWNGVRGKVIWDGQWMSSAGPCAFPPRFPCSSCDVHPELPPQLHRPRHATFLDLGGGLPLMNSRTPLLGPISSV